MNQVLVEKDPSPLKLDEMLVDHWPIWEKEVSTFEVIYDQTETCYLLEGEATVTPVDGEPVKIEAGDLVVLMRGLKCTWEITVPVRKHYNAD